ncbi:hypothetical protein DL96DRAFT_1620583 [Flagelloscypha sp. PMI_526]|nr:hypothetical protein DL96DRAFT_1620583 [Flagelloscypha sp. PMI_526]
MVKMCAAILTTLCLGYDVYDGIAANCLSNEDLGILNFRNFRSLQTLQFDIIPEEINSTPGDSPTPFLLWLAAEVEGIVEIQGPRHAFSCLRFDFVTVTETEDDVSRILQWTKGWKALDMVLAKESVHLVFFIEFDYFPRFDNPMARIFPLCSGKGMACLEVYEDCLEAQFGIRNVVLQA